MFIFSMTVLIFKVDLQKPVVVEKIVMVQGGQAASERVQASAPQAPAAAPAPAETAPEPDEPAPPPPPPKPKPSYQLLETGKPFKTSTHVNALLGVRLLGPKGKKVLEVEYDLKDGEWVQMFQDVNVDLSKFTHIEFSFLGEGNDNTLELKLVDADGSNYGIFWPHKTGVTSWTTIEMPMSSLKYLWGGDNVMDWKHVRQIYFAVSLKSGDQGGRGKV